MTMINTGSKRELLERLIVSELIAKRGEGPLARKHFTRVPRMLANAVPANEVRTTRAEAVRTARAQAAKQSDPQEPDEE